MKVLLVSFWFPPTNIIGAVRAGKLAEHLHAAGHDVRVLCADVGEDRSLPLALPEDRVVRTGFRRSDVLFGGSGTKGGGVTDASAPRTTAAGADPAWKRWMRRHYYAALRIPDARAGWIGPGAAAGLELLRGWRPDLIYASGPPHSALLLAARLSKRSGVPWVAELRDLWSDNCYYEFPAWRRPIDRFLERRALTTASGLVTMSAPWRDMLARHHDKPLAVVMNGYAPEDFADLPPPAPVQPGTPLRIAYAGSIYPGYRDPSPLFAAIARLGCGPDRVQADFYGCAEAAVMPLAARHGVEGHVRIHGRVPYRRSLEIQRQADALLLMQWDDPTDAGNLPAKFFEYVGARRPILFLGYQPGVLGGLIRSRNLGIASNRPAEIAAGLSGLLAQRDAGGIADLPAEAAAGLTRADQFGLLDEFLVRCLSGPARTRQAAGGIAPVASGSR